MELKSEIEHFEIASSSLNQYVIVEPYPVNQKEIDHKVVLHFTYGQLPRDVKQYVLNFLNYHYNYSSNSVQFVRHIESILNDYVDYFNEYANRNKNIDAYIANWLSQTKSQPFSKKAVKEDPALEDLFYEKSFLISLIKQLQLKSYTNPNSNRWAVNKNQLVALFQVLKDEDIIKHESNAAYGRIFGKFFQIDISEQLTRSRFNSDIYKPFEELVLSIKT